VGPGEQFLTAALRELSEKTGLGFLTATLLQALKSSAVFDHALRSPRGRFVAQAFYFPFGEMRQLPEVWAADGESMEVKWVHKDELPSYVGKLFEDQDCILDHFIGIEGF
jgi:bifunctional NMN adenylyltransferase/nudix hydrolase